MEWAKILRPKAREKQRKRRNSLDAADGLRDPARRSAMTAKSPQVLRCAIYTRKSTEHGMELEFNSLDAQREACEAYIKSQAHEGWQALSEHYDDPAYSGGSLDRPALQQLLTDIDAGRVNVVVVYKIDRLTRSLADFAKLVEIFDKKNVSFVAVTQQFNTTTSMGRLTLNVLLSFAQFERELSSERVRDKVAASRRKGKWTGGGIPLGYDVKDKKLIINPAEAETVRIIFTRYLELKCLRLLRDDLDCQGIVSKRRKGRSGRQAGGRNLTHGPLAHLLKNRTYLGEMGHNGEWFTGEHEPIIERATFDQVQELLKANSVARQRKRSENGALLTGLLYDDRGNRMSPSFSTKRDVRYRFYISSALLKGRKQEAGTLPRISGPDLEAAVLTALKEQKVLPSPEDLSTNREIVGKLIERVEVSQRKVRIALKTSTEVDGTHLNVDAPKVDEVERLHASRHIDIAWRPNSKGPLANIEENAIHRTDSDPALVPPQPVDPDTIILSTQTNDDINRTASGFVRLYAKTVDSDGGHFTVEQLRKWKLDAEKRSFEAIVAPVEARAQRAEFGALEAAVQEIVDRLGLSAQDDIETVTTRVLTAATADLATFKHMPGWPPQAVALNLRITEQGSGRAFHVSGLAAAIETFSEITVIAPPGTGKTTTLLQVTEAVLSEAHSISIFVPLGEWSTQSESLLESIVRRAAYHRLREQHLMLLAHHGRLVLTLDGWNEVDSEFEKARDDRNQGAPSRVSETRFGRKHAASGPRRAHFRAGGRN